MVKIKCTCRRCGKEFYKYPSVLRGGGGHFCSRPCRDFKKEKIERSCIHCKKVFYVMPSRLRYGWGKHCSSKCARLENKMGWGNWHRTNPDYSKRRSVYDRLEPVIAHPILKPTKEQLEYWDKILVGEGLSMDRGRIFKPIQFEEHEDIGLRMARRKAAGA
jgi:hypothetical protein